MAVAQQPPSQELRRLIDGRGKNRCCEEPSQK
jgi:hypothetical protein